MERAKVEVQLENVEIISGPMTLRECASWYEDTKGQMVERYVDEIAP